MERHTPDWRKSTYSGNGIDCVEVAHDPTPPPTADWRKASYSGNGINCVETGQTPGAILVRDTKVHGTGPILRFTADTWTRFTTSIKR